MKLIKIVGILTIILVLATSIANATFTISETQLYSKGKCKPLLKVASNGGEITVTKVFYKNNGKEYPAYCVNKELGGVGEYGSYSVTINEAVSNPQVWRAITNGYPYKSLESLGVLDEDEAYAATKQAVYCVLYGYDLSRYLPIGDAGERTLNAIKKIVNIARNTGDTKPSNQIKIIENEDWKIDEKNKTYITKTLEIKTECSVQKYIISLDLTDAEIEEFIYTNDKDQEIKTNLLGEIWNYSNDEKYTVITYFYADRNKDFEDWNNWNTKKMQEKYGLDKFKNAKEIKFIAYIPDLNYLKEDEENIIDLGVEDIIDVK